MDSKLLCSDVLAIHCMDDFVFAGIGCQLHVFNKSTYKLEKKIRCLYPYNIHGIVDGLDNKFAVYGANAICIYNVSTAGGKLSIEECPPIGQLNDWIIAVKFFPFDGHIHLAILLAHNNVRIYNIQHNKQCRDVWCKEKCILYGGSISGKTNGDLVIFSGTVFQEILIWEVKQNSSLQDVSVLHRLRGHNGVIFSVIYNPLARLICSTSDDRTVRLWKVTDDCNTEGNDTNWEQAEVQLTKTMFGHTARVWRSVIRNETLITIGEDSLMCTWSLEGKLLDKIYAHHGAAIWSIGVSDDGKSIFTGGADGAINVWPVTTDCDTWKTELLPNDESCHTLKYICYLSSGTLVIVSEDGHLFCYDTKNGSYDQTREVLHLGRFSCYSVMQVSPCRRYICFASRDGCVAIYSEERDEADDRRLQRVLEERIIDTQIFSVQWLQDNKIVACGAHGILKLFHFTVEGVVNVESSYELPPSRERWLTAAIIFDELLVCGDRAGNVHTFQLGKSTVQDRIETNDKPIQTLAKVHGRIGVQSFIVLNSKLISTGRNGVIKFYEFRKDGLKGQLDPLHSEKMPMEWISGTLRAVDDIFVLGFKEVEFLVYSMAHRRILTRIPCGGGHRSWDCTLTNELITFAYIRKKKVFVFNSSLGSLKPLNLLNGFHVKEVCCVQPLMQIDQQSLLISGGEDGALRLTRLHDTQTGTFRMRTLGIFSGHISCVKSIAITRLRQDTFCDKYLVFSGGGRAQIKVWEISVKRDGNKLQNGSDDIGCSDVTSHMLYGMNQQRGKPWRDTNQPSYIMHPETRYMAIDIYHPPKSPRNILVFVACADGCVRIFSYDTTTRHIQFKRSAECANRCILKLHVLTYNERVIVLTMSTDGIIRFIDFTDAASEILEDDVDSESKKKLGKCTGIPLEMFTVHQSGINSYDLKMIEGDEYLLATGGDDNLFSLIRFKVSMSNDEKIPSVTLSSKWSSSSAHSAKITGVKFKNGDTIFSVSVDQQFIKYSYKYCNGVLSATIVTRILTFVTDVQGFVLWPATKDEESSSFACIYGNGFELLAC